MQRSAYWAEKSAKPNFVIHTDEEIETTTAASASSSAAALAAGERVPLGTLPMPKPVIKDDAEDDEFGLV